MRPSQTDPDVALAIIRQKLEHMRAANSGGHHNRPMKGGSGSGRGRGVAATTECGDSSSEDGSDSIVQELRQYEEEVSRESELILALAMRCYHLPGNSSARSDWVQYIRNTHPIIGMCCHQRQHPVRFPTRLLQAAGSLVFGLAMTNIIWLYFFNGSNQPALTINVQGFGVNAESTSATSDSTFRPTSSTSGSEFVISQAMIVCWTLGALLHSIFDNTVWYMTACVCCLSSSHLDAYRKWGTYCILVCVMLITAVATLALVVRTSAEKLGDTPYYYNANGSVNETQLSLHEASMYKLFISYAIEFAIALFFYYPIVATILFSGILGCGNVPILGGRPYEVKMEAQRRAKENRRSALDMLPFELPESPNSSPRMTARR